MLARLFPDTPPKAFLNKASELLAVCQKTRACRYALAQTRPSTVAMTIVNACMQSRTCTDRARPPLTKVSCMLTPVFTRICQPNQCPLQGPERIAVVRGRVQVCGQTDQQREPKVCVCVRGVRARVCARMPHTRMRVRIDVCRSVCGRVCVSKCVHACAFVTGPPPPVCACAPTQASKSDDCRTLKRSSPAQPRRPASIIPEQPTGHNNIDLGPMIGLHECQECLACTGARFLVQA